jgi:starch-binding outer membrane protein, SusD/RagB family
MKKIIYIYITLFIFSVSSCEDFLNEQPISQLSAGNYWKTEHDIITATAGMYDGLQDIVDDNFVNWGEGRSDNLVRGGTGETQFAFMYNAMTADMDATDWTGLYAVILRANLIIKYVPLIEGNLSESEKNHYLAQAYAIRAYCHLLGVKVWGDFPLIQEVIEDKEAKPARTPVAEVLAAVVADLLTARELVDEDILNVYEVDLGGILAILTDAYMWQHAYQNVIGTTDELLAVGRYELERDSANWKLIFTDPGSLGSPSEPIWSLYRNVETDPGSGIADYLGSSDHTSSFVMDPNLLARWEQQGDQDFRESATYDTLIAEQEGTVPFIWKYYDLDVADEDETLGQQMPKGDEAEIRNPMYRLADILLLRAEAFNQLGNEQEAVDLLNDIRTRARLDPVSVDDFNSKEELEMAILDERQLELFAEGKRWFDLRRTGLVKTVMDPLLEQRQAEAGQTVVGFGDEGLALFPVNRDVLNANPSLEQNPGYTR